MEINLRNVPFSEELLFYIRRCAGPVPRDMQVRVHRSEVPTQVYEVCLVRRDGADDVAVVEADPDVYLAVRNAFAVLRERERYDETSALRPAACADGSVDIHG